MEPSELRNAVADLVAAIDAIVAAWEHGDLAGAVHAAQDEADHYRTEPEVRTTVSGRE